MKQTAAKEKTFTAFFIIHFLILEKKKDKKKEGGLYEKSGNKKTDFKRMARE